MTRRFRPVFLLPVLLFSALSCQWLEGPSEKMKADKDTVREEFERGERQIPVLFLSTHKGKGITDRDNWSDGEISLISLDGVYDIDDMDVRVKGRGNASWSFPKKAFDIKADEEFSLLGMPPEARWCVLANWRDRTVMRNAVALRIASLSSLSWTPKGVFVDLYMDGTFMGNYYITQKVAIGTRQVNVDSGGTLVCLDEYFDKDFRFKTTLKEMPVNILPRTGTTLDKTTFKTIQNRMNAAETALYKGDSPEGVLDVESFCDWLLVHEVTGNDEPTRPHSVYMHWTSGGPITAGPAWDFDCRTFRPGVSGLVDSGAVWFGALLGDEGFVETLKGRWAVLKEEWAEDIPGYIEELREYLRSSAEVNSRLWPINTTFFSSNGDEKLTWEQAVDRLREAFLERMDTVDNLISELQ